MYRMIIVVVVVVIWRYCWEGLLLFANSMLARLSLIQSVGVERQGALTDDPHIG